MALWTPAEITTLRWYEPSKMSQADGSAISSLTDYSGNSDHAVQGTSTKRPTFKTSILNGLAIARLDGGDCLELTELFDSSASVGSMFVVAKQNASTTNGALLSNRQATPASAGWTLRCNSPTEAIYFHPGVAPTPTAATVNASFNLIEVVRSGLSVTIGVNGAMAAPATLSGYTASTYNKTAIGVESGAAGGFLQGDIAAIVILPIAADITTRQLLEGYFHHRYGLAALLAADHPYKSAAPTIPDLTTIRAIHDQPYSILGDYIRSILDQTYHITARQLAVLIQVYGLRMLAILAQHYGDMVFRRQILVQEYGDCAFLRRICRQDYGDAFRYRATCDQEWYMPEGLRAIMEQRYGIAEAQYRAICDSVYDLSERDQLRAIAEQLYVLAAGEALVQRTEIEVTCDGVAITSMGNINIEQDEAVYHMSGELQLYSQAEYLLFKAYRSAVLITVDGQTFQFIPEIPRKSRQPGETTYIIPLASQTVLLGAPHNRLAATVLSGMASKIVADLAAPFTVDWRLVDWFIPPGKLATNGDPAITVIKRIAEAAGGLVQTSPAGVLICRPEYPVSVDRWQTAAPDIELTDQDDFFSIAPLPESRPGYNKFFISDQQLSTSGRRPEVVRISDHVNEIRVYQVPWDESITRIRLRHSGGDWVEQIDQGIVIETIADEQIEIVAGVGRQTAKPVYKYLSHLYKQADMGALTVTESGEVSTATPGNTLVHLTYQTRYFSFLTTDMQTEDVQWYPDYEGAI